MLRTLKVLASLTAAVPLAVFLACSSSNSAGGDGGPSPGACDVGGADGGTCEPGVTPAYTSCLTGSDLQTPTVSFAQSIKPLFNTSCSISTPGTCHALQQPGNSTPYLVFLGSPDGGIDGATVLSGLVGKPASEDPGMSLIAAGDPDNSYLMHKLDYDQCQFATACDATKNPVFTGCGVGMPYQSGILDQDTRDDIRRWIAQGAKNN
jgi:hypothetical protein